MQAAVPITHDVLLVGGGHAHVAVLKRFGMRPIPGVRLTLISRDAYTPYSGMLPGLLAGVYDFDQVHIDLRPLARFAGARFIHDRVAHIDLKKKHVGIPGRPAVAFDIISIDVGSTPAAGGIAGAREFAIAIKPMDKFLQSWADVEERLLAKSEPRLVVVGGGAGGVEAGLSLVYRLRQRGQTSVRLSIASRHLKPLSDHSPAVQAAMARAMGHRDVEFLPGGEVTAIEKDRVILLDGRTIEYDAVILVTHADAPVWLGDCGMALDDKGFIRVNTTLQSVSHPFLFAAGDCAVIETVALPRSGVYAVRQGPALAENIARAVSKKNLKPYKPQPRTLALITTGGRHAIASYGGRSWSGHWVWRWKDYIDRRWMKKYQLLPKMAVHAGEMRCGGCGAKIANDVLRLGLQEVPPPRHDNVVIGVSDADDAAVIRQSDGRLLVQSVDFFRPFIDDPYLFAKITANHCLNDLYAMGVKPHSALAQIALPFAAADKLASELRQIMAGATEVLSAAGADLLGGHTAEGAELTFGLTVNGFASEGALLTKGGLRPDDALILTKALGTGVIFAADMLGQTSSKTAEAALATMLVSNARAAEIFLQHDLKAATDITGFGFLGHALEMADASGGLGLEIDLAALPVIPGACALFEAGHASSLQPANLSFADRLTEAAPEAEKYPLLFDPQTAGGLLAGAPAAQAEKLVAELRAAGYGDAAVVGQARGNGAITLIGENSPRSQK